MWAAEAAGTNKLPSIGTTLALFALLTVLLLHALGGPSAVAEQANRGKPPTLCQEHAGRSGWDAVCRTESPVADKRP